MDLAHSKTIESEVYNIPDSKSTDMIQPPLQNDNNQNGAVTGTPKSKS